MYATDQIFFVTNTDSNDWTWPRWHNTDKEKEFILIIYSVTLSEMNFKDFDAQRNFAKHFKYGHWKKQLTYPPKIMHIQCVLHYKDILYEKLLNYFEHLLIWMLDGL